MIDLRKTLYDAHETLEQAGVNHALIGGFALASYSELQDKADIQKLLALPNINLELVKKYAELFNEWPVIQTLKVK